MKFWHYRSAWVLALCLTLSGLAGCAAKAQRPAQKQEVALMHERLSQTIMRHGFSHGIRSQRNELRDIDSIYLSVPLDSLKRRHENFVTMLHEIATICASPEFSALTIYIELGTRDEKDLTYMHDQFNALLAGKKNIQVVDQPDERSDITITVVQPKLAQAR